MAALIDATTGYSSDVADWTDTTPQPDSADSGASLQDPTTFASFIWPTFSTTAEGITHDVGDFRNIFIKAFEAGTDPALSFSGALTAIAFVLVGALVFTANLALSAQILKRFPLALAAVTAFHGAAVKQSMITRAGAINFNTAFVRARLLLVTAALSFAGAITNQVRKRIAASLAFLGRIARLSLIFKSTTLRLRSLLTERLNGIGPILLTLDATLNLGGFFRIGKLFDATLSFITSFGIKTLKRFSPILSFTTQFVRHHGSQFFIELRAIAGFGTSLFKGRTKFLQSILDFRALLFSRPATIIRKSLHSVVAFSGSIEAVTSFIRVLLQSSLRFRGRLYNAWGNIVAFFNVVIDAGNQILSGSGRDDTRALMVNNEEQDISDSPTLITGIPSTQGVLFIKNMDDSALVEVDASSGFDLFPQSIFPGCGVYLSPDPPAAEVYARSSSPSSRIQVIAASRTPGPIKNISGAINFSGDLSITWP